MTTQSRKLVDYAMRRHDEIDIFNDMLDKPNSVEEFYTGLKALDYLCPINNGLMSVLIYIRRNMYADGCVIFLMRDLADACDITPQQAGRHIKTLEQKGLLKKEQDGMWKVFPPLKKV